MIAVAMRKTFSGQRKRKPGQREPNGRLRRRPRTQTAADILSVARNQPHRKGSSDQKVSTLIGRLVSVEPIAVSVSGFTPQQLYDLAQKFLRVYQRHQVAIASRSPLSVTGGPMQRPDPDPEAERRAMAAWASVSRALRLAGERVEKAAILAILDAAPDQDQRTLAPWVTLSLPAAFLALDRHFRGR